MGQKRVKVRSTLSSPDGQVGSGPELIASSRECCDNGATTGTSLQNLPDKSRLTVPPGHVMSNH